jgi:hypothetical protein
MLATATKQTVVVSSAELIEIGDWERKFAKAKKAAADAEKQVKFLRLQLAEKVLGVKTEDELKSLTPDQLLKKFTKRFEAGDWKPERGAPDFEFSKSSEGRYPAWAQLFASELGETAAARIKAETPVVYSYTVQVALP